MYKHGGACVNRAQAPTTHLTRRHRNAPRKDPASGVTPQHTLEACPPYREAMISEQPSRAARTPTTARGSIRSRTSTTPTPESVNGNLGALAERMGITFTETTLTAGHEKYVATMPVEGNTQPYGLLHGGASAALAETVGSALSMGLAGPNRVAVGMGINAIHHRPVTGGHVTATATVIAHGRTTVTTEIVVTNDRGKRVCTSTLLAALQDAPVS